MNNMTASQIEIKNKKVDDLCTAKMRLIINKGRLKIEMGMVSQFGPRTPSFANM